MLLRISLDTIFQILVYLISIYLIFIKHSFLLNICGFIILLSHLYKDLNKIQVWPQWTEYIGFLIGIILIYEGNNMKNKNYFVIFIGCMKILAHIRQFIFKDNRYYY